MTRGRDPSGMPPEVGERAPEFEALRCDGETFRPAGPAETVGSRGLVLVFFGFAGSAIATNWWRRYERRGWGGFDGVPVVGVCRDGPYAVDAFLRELDGPFRLFSDVDARAIDRYGLLVERDGMAGTRTARRAWFVLDSDLTVRGRWILDDWISPAPADEVEAAVREL